MRHQIMTIELPAADKQHRQCSNFLDHKRSLDEARIGDTRSW